MSVAAAPPPPLVAERREAWSRAVAEAVEDLDTLAALLELDVERRACITEAEAAQADRNAASKDVGRAKAQGDDAEFERLRALVADKKAEIADLEARARAADEALHARLMELPNSPDADVPDGTDEAGNVELRRGGTPRAFDFAPLEHFDIPAVKPGMDFATAAKLSGSRFVVLRGAVARVHRALAQFMLDVHVTENGLEETATPVLVRDDAMTGTDKLPEVRRGQLQDARGLLADPHLRGDADLLGRGRHRWTSPTCPAAWRRTRSASGPRRAAPGATRRGCCASTSSRRSRWCRSPVPTAPARSWSA